MIIFYKQRKHIAIPQDLLQMKIGHSCVAIKKITQIRYVSCLIWKYLQKRIKFFLTIKKILIILLFPFLLSVHYLCLNNYNYANMQFTVSGYLYFVFCNVTMMLLRSQNIHISTLSVLSGLRVIRTTTTYEVCPKSNETVVIKSWLKNIEIYQSPSK